MKQLAFIFEQPAYNCGMKHACNKADLCHKILFVVGVAGFIFVLLYHKIVAIYTVFYHLVHFLEIDPCVMFLITQLALISETIGYPVNSI